MSLSFSKVVYKPIGYTPSMLMGKILSENPELVGIKYSFYGKLDPMAHGLMLILFGDECRNPVYLNLNKTYQASIVLGIKTDTYDQMGKIVDFPNLDFSIGKIKKLLEQKVGKFKQPYPPYSYLLVRSRDKTVKKPLWWFAQNRRLDDIHIPSKIVEIYRLQLLEYGYIPFTEIQSNVKRNVREVKGDFRQGEIIEHWDNFISTMSKVSFPYIKIELEVSSGTYIRSIANMLNGFAYDIYRTSIGDITL